MEIDVWIKGAKIAFGCTLAIMLAERIGLLYASSAGIITLLTIQNTRRETLQLAWDRMQSFLVSITLAGFIHFFPGIHAVGFGIFLFLLVEISYYKNWQNSISVNAVFGTHIFIMEQGLTLSFLFNEMGLLMIGAGIAVFLNLWMRR